MSALVKTNSKKSQTLQQITKAPKPDQNESKCKKGTTCDFEDTLDPRIFVSNMFWRVSISYTEVREFLSKGVLLNLS